MNNAIEFGMYITLINMRYNKVITIENIKDGKMNV